MEQINSSKNADLVQSAKLPFIEKLALTNAASRIVNHLVLSETFDHPVLEVIKLFNLAVEEGVFARYALVGGLAVEYYGAPINTVDADFLVLFPTTTSGLLDPSAFYEFFLHKGAFIAGEYLVLHGLKFQLIPANSELDAEALATALSVSEQGTAFFVITPEYLIALKLRAWRYKDRLHINHLLDSSIALDQVKFSSILHGHHLDQRWKQLLAERTE